MTVGLSLIPRHWGLTASGLSFFFIVKLSHQCVKARHCTCLQGRDTTSIWVTPVMSPVTGRVCSGHCAGNYLPRCFPVNSLLPWADKHRLEWEKLTWLKTSQCLHESHVLLLVGTQTMGWRGPGKRSQLSEHMLLVNSLMLSTCPVPGNGHRKKDAGKGRKRTDLSAVWRTQEINWQWIEEMLKGWHRCWWWVMWLPLPL